jgi:hypothetical protein
MAVGAIAAMAIRPSKPEWILVADGSLNLNNRKYDLAALKGMVESARGIPIKESEEDWSDGRFGELAKLLGVVERARLVTDRVYIQVRWFAGKRPSSGFITPIGVANRPGDAKTIDGTYRLKYFVVNKGSAFLKATAIS